MTNPTSNFGWQMPTSTDLVTDLPADFETFGQAVDTTLADLKGGTTGQVLSKASNTDMDFTWVAQDDSNAIQNAIVDAKGDLIAASAADTPARLAVGNNGETLVADSSTATGLKWVAPSSGGMTVLASGSLSGSSVVLNSIAGTYNNLQLVLRDYYMSTNAGIGLKVNAVSNYNLIRDIVSAGTVTRDGLTGNGNFSLAYNNIAQSDNDSATIVNIYDYASSVNKNINALISYTNTGAAKEFMNYNGNAVMNAAVTSVTVTATAGNFSGGTYILYGVK